jgi:Fe-Mn family superoxide dismutase
MDNAAESGMLPELGRGPADPDAACVASPQGDTAMTELNRRQLLRAAGAGAAVLGFGPLALADEKKDEGFTLPKLPYAYDALEPEIDAQTMMIHHDKHHAAYVANLNKALADQPALLKKSIRDILSDIDAVPMPARQAVINNGGGHSNHTLFWQVMGTKKGEKPSGDLAKAIDGAFDSFAKFQEKMTAAAMGRFGSGWAWLVVDTKAKKLDVISSANQDSPYMKGQTPLLGIDVWEHAYYLKYKNARADYVKAWWNVVNWDYVAMRYADEKKG